MTRINVSADRIGPMLSTGQNGRLAARFVRTRNALEGVLWDIRRHRIVGELRERYSSIWVCNVKHTRPTLTWAQAFHVMTRLFGKSMANTLAHDIPEAWRNAFSDDAYVEVVDGTLTGMYQGLPIWEIPTVGPNRGTVELFTTRWTHSFDWCYDPDEEDWENWMECGSTVDFPDVPARRQGRYRSRIGWADNVRAATPALSDTQASRVLNRLLGWDVGEWIHYQVPDWWTALATDRGTKHTVWVRFLEGKLARGYYLGYPVWEADLNGPKVGVVQYL